MSKNKVFDDVTEATLDRHEREMVAEKARKMFDAANKLATEFDREGKPLQAISVVNAFADMPVDSLARLYDILNAEAQ